MVAAITEIRLIVVPICLIATDRPMLCTYIFLCLHKACRRHRRRARLLLPEPWFANDDEQQKQAVAHVPIHWLLSLMQINLRGLIMRSRAGTFAG